MDVKSSFRSDRPAPALAWALTILFILLAACSGGGVAANDKAGSRRGGQAREGVEASDSPGVLGTTQKPGSGSNNKKIVKTTPKQVATNGAVPKVAVFTPGEDRIGITPTSITLCVHAPFKYLSLLRLAAKEDLGVYWDMLNERGGVQGRTVQVIYEDDENTVQGTEAALERCREQGAFAIVSGTLSVEILDAARAWAERTHTLYYFNYSSESPRRAYSFSPFISLDRAGRYAAQWILRAHADKKIGLVYRQDPSYDSGAKSFLRTLAARGVETIVTVGTSANQTIYRDQVAGLKGKADVVFILDDPLGSTPLMKQARQQDYAPQWVLLSGLNFTTELLGSDAVSPHPIEALSVWPPYSPGVHGGPYARYGDEIAKFEQAFERYTGRPSTSDATWVFWSFWHVMAGQFDQCGRDCTRNRLIAVTKWDAEPFCSMEFTNGSNFAGTAVSIARAYSPSVGTAAWAEVPGTICKTSF